MTGDPVPVLGNTLISEPLSAPEDVLAGIEQIAAAAFEAGYDRAARTLFAVAELLRADAMAMVRQ